MIVRNKKDLIYISINGIDVYKHSQEKEGEYIYHKWENKKLQNCFVGNECDRYCFAKVMNDAEAFIKNCYIK